MALLIGIMGWIRAWAPLWRPSGEGNGLGLFLYDPVHGAPGGPLNDLGLIPNHFIQAFLFLLSRNGGRKPKLTGFDPDQVRQDLHFPCADRGPVLFKPVIRRSLYVERLGKIGRFYTHEFPPFPYVKHAGRAPDWSFLGIHAGYITLAPGKIGYRSRYKMS